MHIGLIGVGRIGAFHASALRGLPGVACELPRQQSVAYLRRLP